MPKKIRELKSRLAKAGFPSRSGKGGHNIWTHPRWRGRDIVLSGNDGRDARPYQEKQVETAVRFVEGNP